MTVNWSKDLGSPTQPGKVRVRGVGEVEVGQEDIDKAARLGGNLNVEIAECTANGDEMPQFVLGHFIPA